MRDIDELLVLMARLRDPEYGCPWDLKQSFSTLAPYALEEACEVVEAIEREDYENLREELGDLLFQVVFHARIAEESNLFDFSSVIHGLVEKMIHRHPHVFPDGTLTSKNTSKSILSYEEVQQLWRKRKEEEKQKNNKGEKNTSILPDALPLMLPTLRKAEKIQNAVAGVGFDLDTVDQVEDKIKKDLSELNAAVSLKEGRKRMEEKVGDLLFACVYYARHLDVDPDMALRAVTKKFECRFGEMKEYTTREGENFDKMSWQKMEDYWQRIESL
ncbi:MAG: nucleoside triphosphate pyrophosphohydrolase [Candidatus Endonucleobacter sp. (ex Gigantidas childressi)]|nr:nucleoside triphosphate pyrophosphohydrolase [Candidatus Endonucleobacter sp. (ex Gigantidas childressi)]